jgi:predicted TIM-barrel fold metal-dependent hydrolase
VNPRLKSAGHELKRCIEEFDMKGMKLWVSTFCDDPLVFPLVEQCALYDIPVLVHAFYKATGQLPYESLGENVANLAKRYPTVRFIMAHLGANSYRELKPIRRCKNVWADYSGTLFRRDELDYAKSIIGADRLLFGTDMDLAPLLLKLGQLDDSQFSQAEKDKVLYQNALQVFRTPDRSLH